MKFHFMLSLYPWLIYTLGHLLLCSLADKIISSCRKYSPFWLFYPSYCFYESIMIENKNKKLASLTKNAVFFTPLQVVVFKSRGTFGHFSFSPLIFAKLFRFWQAAWKYSLNSPIKVLPQILYWIEVSALTRPLQNIHLIVLKLFLCSFSWMLQVVVLLDNKCSYGWMDLPDTITHYTQVISRRPVLIGVSHFKVE